MLSGTRVLYEQIIQLKIVVLFLDSPVDLLEIYINYFRKTNNYQLSKNQYELAKSSNNNNNNNNNE